MAEVIMAASPIGVAVHAPVSGDRSSSSSSVVAPATATVSFVPARHVPPAAATPTLSLQSSRHVATPTFNHAAIRRSSSKTHAHLDQQCQLFASTELLGSSDTLMRGETDGLRQQSLKAGKKTTTTTTTMRRLGVQASAAAGASDSTSPSPNSSSVPSSATSSSSSGGANAALVTGFFFFMWYLLNVIFNILNKKIYNYFPYPWFVSTIHLVVGVAYILVTWATGITKRAPISNAQIKALIPVAFCHAVGHVMSNVSFNAVAVSFTHTIKALEPFFNAAASQFILGQSISLPVWLSLAPVVFGVALASTTELSFNWIGFGSAMTSNIAFTYRNIVSKSVMTGMDSTNLYAYVSIMSLIMCLPPTLILEGPVLTAGVNSAMAKVGASKFVLDLVCVGLFYHLYNQIATNTLERVAPLTHAVGNVLKRVFVIGFSILVFGNKISTTTGIGTAIAIAGVATYSILKAKEAEKKLKAKAAA